MIELDHVILAVRDLDAAARRLMDDVGLASIDGGRHEGGVTANRIVPLGASYIELLAVVDRVHAENSVTAARVVSATESGDALLAWAVRTDNVEAVGERLSLDVWDQSRTRPDGITLRWHVTGVDQALTEPCFPFFIQWGVPATLHPGRALAEHPVQAFGIQSLALSGDEGGFRRWVGEDSLPVRFTPGNPGIAGVEIRTAEGNVTIPGRPAGGM